MNIRLYLNSAGSKLLLLLFFLSTEFCKFLFCFLNFAETDAKYPASI